jgi:death-on-curing protein
VRYLTLNEVLELHGQIISQSGGTPGILNLTALESALAQPRMTFGGTELYPTIAEKASAIGFSLIKNHPFVDGNKRSGHAAMEVFLVLNGFEIRALYRSRFPGHGLRHITPPPPTLPRGLRPASDSRAGR